MANIGSWWCKGGIRRDWRQRRHFLWR